MPEKAQPTDVDVIAAWAELQALWGSRKLGKPLFTAEYMAARRRFHEIDPNGGLLRDALRRQRQVEIAKRVAAAGG